VARAQLVGKEEAPCARMPFKERQADGAAHTKHMHHPASSQWCCAHKA